jgi:hypothetical protein
METQFLEDTEFEECIEMCNMFLWVDARSIEQLAAKFVEKMFLQALEQTGNIFLILDDFDKISRYYTSKVNIFIRSIRDKTGS